MTRENDTKRTQIYFVGPGNPRNQTPPPILRGGGVVGTLLQHTTEYVLNCLRMEHAQNGKQKICEQLRLERPPRKNKVGRRKGKEAAFTTTTSTHMGLIHAL